MEASETSVDRQDIQSSRCRTESAAFASRLIGARVQQIGEDDARCGSLQLSASTPGDRTQQSCFNLHSTYSVLRSNYYFDLRSNCTVQVCYTASEQARQVKFDSCGSLARLSHMGHQLSPVGLWEVSGHDADFIPSCPDSLVHHRHSGDAAAIGLANQ
jgi:hypothetical protein